MSHQMLERLMQGERLDKESFTELLRKRSEMDPRELFDLAKKTREKYFGNKIYIRGLIEFTNYCKNDCYYCGIRRGNRKCFRYRLSQEEILECCKKGYDLGFRTFVLQGGEDSWWNDERLESLIFQMKQLYPECAVTLSLGERSEESYRRLFAAGADRYLLRHETATKDHYRKLHPQEQSFENRIACLKTLKEIGYQTGCGFMVGSPYQTVENLAEDLYFIQEFQPHMVGIGPFIPHKDTPFGNCSPGTAEDTLFFLALIRLILPKVLLPATTALGTIAKTGREQGILAGTNVIMPNLSPEKIREHYTLYNGKLHTGAEAAEHLRELKERMEKMGCRIVVDRGDAR